VLLISNSARQAVRTINFMRVLHKKSCRIVTIAWKRDSNDIDNCEEYGCSEVELIEGRHILAYMIKALIVGFRYPSDIYVTIDIRLIPILLVLSKFKKNSIVIYDSKELPSVTAKAYLDRNKWPEFLNPIKKFIYNLYEYFEKKCFQSIDGILCLDSRDNFLLKKARKLNPNSVVIMNAVDINKVLAYKSYRKYHEIYKDKQVVVFSGNLYPDKGLFQYMQMSKILKEKIPDFKLVLCGAIKMEVKEFQTMLSTYGIEEYVDVFRRLPFNEHIGLLMCCKVGLALMSSKRPKFKMIGPGTAQKIFTYMAAGLPIITSKGHFARIIEEERCGIAVDFFDVTELIWAVRWLLEDEKTRMQMARNALRATAIRYNMEIEGRKICQIIDRAFENKIKNALKS